MKFNRITFLLLTLLIGSNSLHSQTRINKKDQKEIREACIIFLSQSSVVLVDMDAPVDSLRNVSSELVFNRLLLIRDFIDQMAYENLVFDQGEVIRLELTDSIGCIFDTDPQMKLNIRKSSDRWVVFGYDNLEVNQETIDKTKAWIARDLENEKVKDSIKEILKEFVDGWSEMRQYQKSDLLKSLSTNEFHDYIFRNVQYENLQGYGDNPVTIKEIGRVEIHEDTAWCRVGIKGMGGARFVLLLQNKEWKVAGQNVEVYTSEDVSRMEERITSYNELAKFEKYIDDFNVEMEAFFKTGNRLPLEKMATDNMIDQLEIYRRLTGTIDTSFLEIRGLYGSSFPSSDYAIYGDSAYYDHYSDSLRWVKVNDKWMFDEFFVSQDIDNKYDKAQQTFRKFNKLISLSYNWYNTLDENRPPPPVAISSKEPNYTKLKHYHRLNDRHKEIVYETGNDQLCKDLHSLTKEASSKTSFKGIIYVEFDVDNLGKAHDFRALDNIDSEEAKLAEEIVSKLGDWLPNDRKQSSLTNMVVAIEF